MNHAVIPSAAHFVVTVGDHFPFGNIFLTFGIRQRAVLCRQHAYAQLRELEQSGHVDQYEAEFLRFQIGDSVLPNICPAEMEADIQGLIEDDGPTKLFAQEYYHPDVERRQREEAAELRLMSEPRGKRLMQ